MTTDIINDPGTEIYTVSQFNRESRILLETAFQHIWITGEISNLARPASGHLYFTLKDERAATRCALFKQSRRNTPKDLENGMQVNLYARVSLYEPRGDFQLIAQRIEPAGQGALQQRFEQLKKKLQAEGLFDQQRKKPLPNLPKTVGVITSSQGAAIHDILTVLKRRHAPIDVIIYPSLVQGTQATSQIATAIETANQRQECDVLLVSRGGGSLEDLWCFNEPEVAYAIARCSIPIVSAVGHEVDFTIADFVADIRAATPSAAAELVSPDQAQLKQHVQQAQTKLKQLLWQQLQLKQMRLDALKAQLPTPDAMLQQRQQKCDYLSTQLQQGMQHLLQKQQQRFAHLSQLLNSLSPLNTVGRGYAILKQNDAVVSSIKQVNTQEPITATLKDGELTLRITT